MQDCTIKVESLLDKAIELGYNGVCITDHEAISGHVQFLEHYKELKKNGKLPDGFKIGLGNEIYLVDRNDQFDENGNAQKTPQYHLILIAKDKTGHEQLRELSTQAWMNWFRQGPAERVPTFKDDLVRIVSKDPGHLICSTACLGSELATLGIEYLNTKDPAARQKIIDFLEYLQNVFGEGNVFLELQPRRYERGSPPHEQVRYNKLLLRLSEVYNLPYIVSTDSHYFKGDRYVHEAFLNSDATQHGQREMGDFYETTYMMDEEEIMSYLKTHMTEEQARRAIENTQKIHESIEEYDLAHPVIVPEDPHIPSDFKLEGIFDTFPQYEYIQKFAASEDIQERYLLYLIEQGFIEKKQEFNETNLARINEELGTLWEVSARLDQRIAHYYVLDRNIIQNVLWKDSLVGAGRGSVAGFYICYLIDITQISPIEYSLVPWRHLHSSRPEMPDYKKIVFELIFKKYYEENYSRAN